MNKLNDWERPTKQANGRTFLKSPEEWEKEGKEETSIS